MPESAIDELTRWRGALRAELVARRNAIAPAERTRWDAAIAARLAAPLLARPVGTIGFTWPVRGEFDAQPVILRLVAAGWAAALAAVVAPNRPLEFRPWSDGMPLEIGALGIPAPPAGPVAVPDTLLVPLVGFDVQRYRLGYGGGFFDRTLAAMTPRPLTIGVGYELSRVATIRPREHDVAMDEIVTEAALLR
jgi:5-formyltetrahydrofolate cyclo-ligase